MMMSIRTILIIMIFAIPNLYTKDDVKKKSGINENQLKIAEQDTIVYQVFGLDCPGCHSALEKQVNKIPMVTFCQADWLKQEIMVVVKKDSVLTEKVLFERIKKANFTPGKKVVH